MSPIQIGLTWTCSTSEILAPASTPMCATLSIQQVSMLESDVAGVHAVHFLSRLKETDGVYMS